MKNQNDTRTKIVIVSPDEHDRVALRAMLQLVNDFDVVGGIQDGEYAGSPEEATNPDVVLISIGTPDDGAIQVATEVKTSPSNSKIFMLSSIDNDQNLFESLAAGADGYGTRDTEFESLVDGVRSVAGGMAWIDPVVSRRVLQSQPSEVAESLCVPGRERRAISMTLRELEVLRLVAQGLSHQEVANRLRLSAEIFKKQMRVILEKIALGERIQAASNS